MFIVIVDCTPDNDLLFLLDHCNIGVEGDGDAFVVAQHYQTDCASGNIVGTVAMVISCHHLQRE